MNTNLGLQCSATNFNEIATKYRSTLLAIPIIGIQNSIKYMTGRPGVRYKESVGDISASAEIRPHTPGGTKQTGDPVLTIRELETFFGSLVKEFDPLSVVSTVLGSNMETLGEGMKNSDVVKNVVASVIKSATKKLNAALFKAKRNATGTTTMELFNGFDTITASEITAGNIATGKGNLIELDAAITTANAVDKLKAVIHALSPELREQDTFMYCSQDIVDKYNEAYLLTHSGINYNNVYNQARIEGSNTYLVPLVGKSDSSYIHVTTKQNMLVGYDNMGDIERVEVKEFSPLMLTLVMTMFFGTQFESIDKDAFTAVKLFTA